MKKIKLETFKEIIEKARNAPPQTEEQKQETAEILAKLGSNGPTALFLKKDANKED